MVAPLIAAVAGTAGRAVLGSLLKKAAPTIAQGATQGAAGFGMSKLLGNLFDNKPNATREEVTAKLNQNTDFKALSKDEQKQVIDFVMSQTGGDNKLNKQEATNAIQEALNALKAKPSKV